MSFLLVNTGTTANAGDGDSIRLAFTKINRNFGTIAEVIGTTVEEVSETVQDYISTALVHTSHTGLTAVYDDANNKIIFTVTAGNQDWVSGTTWNIRDYAGHAEFTSQTPSPGTRWLDFDAVPIGKTNLVGGNIDFHTYIYGDPTNHATLIGTVYFSRLDEDWTTDVTEVASGNSSLTYDTRNEEGVYIMINTSTTATIYGKIHYSGKLFYSPDGSTQ
jgi:hypothetical protein